MALKDELPEKFETLNWAEKEGVIRITLDRPEVRNAFDEQLILELKQVFQALEYDQQVRVVILEGAGKAFSAGADLKSMKELGKKDPQKNQKQSKKMGALFQILSRCPKPVIGRVHGPAFGGGLGLISVCDLVLASSKAVFGFSEVRLGLTPAVISPFVVRKANPSRLRPYVLSGEVFDAKEALLMGLVNEVVSDERDLDRRIDFWVDAFLKAGPEAIAQSKELLERVAQKSPEGVLDYTSGLIAELRSSGEGQEGMEAFLEKRDPKWAHSLQDSSRSDTDDSDTKGKS